MITIRPERPEDIPGVYRVNELAFERKAEAELVNLLRDHGQVILSLVAEQDGEVVGHVLFSPMRLVTDAGELPAAGLAPMSVLPAYQKTGIGSQLIRAGLADLVVQGWRIAFVLGHSDYYPRFGFVPAVRYAIRSTYDVPDEVFMALELVPGALEGAHGIAHYAEEFNTID